MTPLVVAHRGASGHRPELTDGAFRLAARLGADSIELDLVATRDGQLVVRHDLELSATTDIAEHAELAGLRRTTEVDGQAVTGWFVHDLTLDQVRTLRCRERWPRKRPTSATFDGQYPVMSFADALDLVHEESARRGRLLTVHAELKHAALLDDAGLPLPELTDHVIPGVRWMSFEEPVLKQLGGPVVRLFDAMPEAADLKRVAKYATGVGVRRKAVLGAQSVVARAKQLDLDVLVWTHRAENKHLPADLRVGRNPFGHGEAGRAALRLLRAGADAVITDFPEIVVRELAQSGIGAGSGIPWAASASRALSG